MSVVSFRTTKSKCAWFCAAMIVVLLACLTTKTYAQTPAPGDKGTVLHAAFKPHQFSKGRAQYANQYPKKGEEILFKYDNKDRRNSKENKICCPGLSLFTFLSGDWDTSENKAKCIAATNMQRESTENEGAWVNVDGNRYVFVITCVCVCVCVCVCLACHILTSLSPPSLLPLSSLSIQMPRSSWFNV
jgi:hypothetical protein